MKMKSLAVMFALVVFAITCIADDPRYVMWPHGRVTTHELVQLLAFDTGDRISYIDISDGHVCWVNSLPRSSYPYSDCAYGGNYIQRQPGGHDLIKLTGLKNDQRDILFSRTALCHLGELMHLHEAMFSNPAPSAQAYQYIVRYMRETADDLRNYRVVKLTHSASSSIINEAALRHVASELKKNADFIEETHTDTNAIPHVMGCTMQGLRDSFFVIRNSFNYETDAVTNDCDYLMSTYPQAQVEGEIGHD